MVIPNLGSRKRLRQCTQSVTITITSLHYLNSTAVKMQPRPQSGPEVGLSPQPIHDYYEINTLRCATPQSGEVHRSPAAGKSLVHPSSKLHALFGGGKTVP